jgi:hypothetical protein
VVEVRYNIDMISQQTYFAKAKIYSFALVLILFLITPAVVGAQGIVPCGDTPANACNACHLVVLADNLLDWLFGIVFVIFGVVAFVAGFGLATSGGNQSKLDAAKSKLSNAVIGIIIVFSAWLIVDTLLKALLSGGDLQSVNAKLGQWNEISCSFGEN